MEGKSYSEIKERLGISKGTLSSWLQEYPLSIERIRELRDKNPKRIENFRNTMRQKKENRLLVSYENISKRIFSVSEREMFIAGFFLYWAEGTKTTAATTSLSNTDPAMIRFFIQWLESFGVAKKDLRVHLHLYSDMDTSQYLSFWAKETHIPLSQFRKPYIKKVKEKDITRKGRFGHGTCNIIYENAIVCNEVLMGMKYLQNIFK
ncbi:MAG: hypothetical protein HYT94_02340 [Parcubacteria group bacterium]|nr:hypothetical protein [Parcubacteria group bacterium]